ncbi:hypothetical protein WMY93_031663 [Mugilogobius chulae]|uniref:RING-type domain-containing protein n=1 Tax=Mugilogobius chulae TaxID=88201 RepID=A0AAW0MH51_9GOBI
MVSTNLGACALSTVRAYYRLRWQRFATWCTERSVDPLSCTIQEVLGFHQGLLAKGRSASTLGVVAVAIALGHTISPLPALHGWFQDFDQLFVDFNMSSTRDRSSEETFMCSICLELFSEPVSTPCGHNFCKRCISEAWDTAAPAHVQCVKSYQQT